MNVLCCAYIIRIFIIIISKRAQNSRTIILYWFRECLIIHHIFFLLFYKWEIGLWHYNNSFSLSAAMLWILLLLLLLFVRSKLKCLGKLKILLPILYRCIKTLMRMTWYNITIYLFEFGEKSQVKIIRYCHSCILIKNNNSIK